LLGPFRHDAPDANLDRRAWTALQAGVARSLLRRLDQIVAARNQRAEYVRAALETCEAVRLPSPPDDAAPAWGHVPVLLPDETTRERAFAAANATGVDCTRLYGMAAYRACGIVPDAPCPNAEAMARRLLVLPCHPLAPLRLLERVAQAVRRAVEGASR
jgi:dTDP-4-amino-4,6-dideoxygalactose transaminase